MIYGMTHVLFYNCSFLPLPPFAFSHHSLLLGFKVSTFWVSFAGSGYLTACFALMVGPQGQTVGVDHIPELVSLSIKNIQKSAAATLLKDGSLSVHVGGMISEIYVNLKD